MVRSFHIPKVTPGRFKAGTRTTGGPGESSLMMMATTRKRGDRQTRAIHDSPRSMERFTNGYARWGFLLAGLAAAWLESTRHLLSKHAPDCFSNGII